MWDAIKAAISPELVTRVLEAGAILVIGVLVARMAAVGSARLIGRRIGDGQQLLLRRMVWYALLFTVIATTLRHLGLDLGVLLGAAGILTVALGFASQTSASNLISGVFLLAERPFTVGDIIMVGATTGEVVGIDALSVKLRTFDNLLVRLPNESLLKEPITNLTRYPIRRMDLRFFVAFESPLSALEARLVATADALPLCLDEPRPVFQVLGFGEAGVEVQFSVWTARENFVATRTQLYIEVHQALRAAGIEPGFPRRVQVSAPRAPTVADDQPNS